MVRSPSDRPTARRGERGSVTVEFAVVLPVVALVLTTLVAAVLVVDRIGRLELAAATAARALGRGDDDGARVAVTRAGAELAVRHGSGMVCVELSAAATGPFAMVPRRATACAGEDGG